MERFKNLFDMDTAKVLLASIGGFSATLAFVDIVFKVAIGALTIWYLLKKIRNEK